MPLTPQQLEIMKSAITRSYLPGNKADFSYFDALLKENGPTCPRLPYVWDKVFPSGNKELQQWLVSTFKTKSVTTDPRPSSKPVNNIVRKAINVLQSYKQTP